MSPSKNRLAEEPEVAAAVAKALERLAESDDGWLSKSKMLGGKKDKIAKAAFATLTSDDLVVGLGKLRSSPVFARVPFGTTPRGVAPALARTALERHADGRAGQARLKPIPLTEIRGKKLARWVNREPTAVRKAMVGALSAMQKEGLAFTLKVGRAEAFLFRSDLEAALEANPVTQPSRPSATPGGSPTPAAPMQPPVAGGNRSRVLSAYRAVKSRTGYRNVSLASLQKESGLALSALHAVLQAERAARRANATVGEPTAATADEMAAALQIDGRPHLFIELYG